MVTGDNVSLVHIFNIICFEIIYATSLKYLATLKIFFFNVKLSTTIYTKYKSSPVTLIWV